MCGPMLCQKPGRERGPTGLKGDRVILAQNVSFAQKNQARAGVLASCTEILAAENSRETQFPKKEGGP